MGPYISMTAIKASNSPNLLRGTLVICGAALLLALVGMPYYAHKMAELSPPPVAAETQAVVDPDFQQEMIDFTVTNLMSAERNAGYKDGKTPLAYAIFKTDFMKWVTVDGSKQTYLYYDEGSSALSTLSGQKKRFDYWSGYTAAMREKLPETVKVAAQPCGKSFCAISVDWTDYKVD